MPVEIHLSAKGWLYLLTLQKRGPNSSWRAWGGCADYIHRPRLHSPSRSAPRKNIHCLTGTASGVMLNSVRVRSHNFGFTVIKQGLRLLAETLLHWNPMKIHNINPNFPVVTCQRQHMRCWEWCIVLGLPLILALYLHLSLVPCLIASLLNQKWVGSAVLGGRKRPMSLLTWRRVVQSWCQACSQGMTTCRCTASKGFTKAVINWSLDMNMGVCVDLDLLRTAIQRCLRSLEQWKGMLV